MAAWATAALDVSIETGSVVRWHNAETTPCTRRSSSNARARPRNRAGCSRRPRRACRPRRPPTASRARSPPLGRRTLPPSEKLSGVTLTMPINKRARRQVEPARAQLPARGPGGKSIETGSVAACGHALQHSDDERATPMPAINAHYSRRPTTPRAALGRPASEVVFERTQHPRASKTCFVMSERQNVIPAKRNTIRTQPARFSSHAKS